MENRSKTNNQLFTEYFDLIASRKSKKWEYETRRILNKFHEFIDDTATVLPRLGPPYVKDVKHVYIPYRALVPVKTEGLVSGVFFLV